VFLVRRAWRCVRRGHALAWLLFGTECMAFFEGSMVQPTSLGFLVFTTGLCLAAIKSAERGDSFQPTCAREVPRRTRVSGERVSLRG